jgi:cadmium resistance protein CadD (predicted permease)
MTVLETIAASIVAFASTNVDDVLLLLALMADRRFRTSQVVLGQYVGIATLVIGSVALAAFAIKLPEGTTRWLGVLPILLGLRQLWQLWRTGGKHVATTYDGVKGIPRVALVTISNGADNLAVYVPLLTKIGGGGFVVLVIVFTLMTALWCGSAAWLLRHRSVADLVEGWGHQAMPFVLLLLGLYILLRA